MATILNKNLFVANRVLEFIKERSRPVWSTQILGNDKLFLIPPSAIPELSKDELGDTFLALHRRKAIYFSNTADLNDPWNKLTHFDVEPNKKRLLEFVRIAKDKIFGIKLKTRTEIRDNLAVLHILTRNIKNRIEKIPNVFIFKENEVGIKDFFISGSIEYLEWIADYSGLIKIHSELEADFDYADGRIYPVGAAHQPKSVIILHREKLEELINRIKTTVGAKYKTSVSLFLKNKERPEWRCVKCNRYLDDLSNPLQLTTHLINFIINNYKVCYKCRTRNYFVVSEDGKIRFLSSKETFEDIDKPPKIIKLRGGGFLQQSDVTGEEIYNKVKQRLGDNEY